MKQFRTTIILLVTSFIGGCVWIVNDANKIELARREQGWMTYQEIVEHHISSARQNRDNNAKRAGRHKEFLLSFNTKITECHDEEFRISMFGIGMKPLFLATKPEARDDTTLLDPTKFRAGFDGKSGFILLGCYKGMDDEIRKQNSIAVRNARWSMRTLMGDEPFVDKEEYLSQYVELLGPYKNKPLLAPEECNEDWIQQTFLMPVSGN